jgi:hypothetical protein
MKRRTFLQALGILWATPAWMHTSASAQGVSVVKDTTGSLAPPQPVSGPAALGLPADWKFEMPKRWKAEGGLFARFGAPARASNGALILSGVSVETDPKGIRIGTLAPTGLAVSMTPEMHKVAGSANARLKLDVLNQSYNHFRVTPRDNARKPLVGPYKRPEQIFEGKAFIPVRQVIAGAIEEAGPSAAAVKPLLDALSEQAVLTTPAHQFLLQDGLGNRVVAYGPGVEHAHIDQLVHQLKAQNMRALKLMTYFKYYKDEEEPEWPSTYAQGGTLKEILADSVGGTWHAGGFSAGFDARGRPISSKSDWPTDYGKLTDEKYTDYNAHLFAIDYQAGASARIPPETLAAYYRNADMWDCCAALTVPFVVDEKDPIYKEYFYNPLEVYDRQSAQLVAQNMVKLDTEDFLKQHGAFYCSEGQFTVANLGPQAYSLLKKSAFGNTAFGKLIDTYNAAPEYKDKTVEQRRQLPGVGWSYLRKLGPAKGGISLKQYQHLAETDRTAIYLEWVPEDIQGWQAYGPHEKDGLIARPMTVATMAWSLLRRYVPREGVAHVINEDILRAYRSGNAQVRQAVVALCGGADPDTSEGHVALGHVSVRAATGLLVGLLASKEVREMLLTKGGFKEVLTEFDKRRIERAYDGFVDILRNADYTSQESLDAALLAADESLSSMNVWRRYYNKATKRQYPWRRTLMKYAAPMCFVAWAQQPFLARTGCIRYVATAMSTKQAKISG